MRDYARSLGSSFICAMEVRFICAMEVRFICAMEVRLYVPWKFVYMEVL